jgi:hypothetical protein
MYNQYLMNKFRNRFEVADFFKNVPFKHFFRWKKKKTKQNKKQLALNQIIAIGTNVVIGLQLWKLIDSIIIDWI